MPRTEFPDKEVVDLHDFVHGMVVSLETQYESEYDEFIRDTPFVMGFVFNQLAGFYGLDTRIDTSLYKRTPEEGDRAERMVEELFEKLRKK